MKQEPRLWLLPPDELLEVRLELRRQEQEAEGPAFRDLYKIGRGSVD